MAHKLPVKLISGCGTGGEKKENTGGRLAAVAEAAGAADQEAWLK